MLYAEIWYTKTTGGNSSVLESIESPVTETDEQATNASTFTNPSPCYQLFTLRGKEYLQSFGSVKCVNLLLLHNCLVFKHHDGWNRFPFRTIGGTFNARATDTTGYWKEKEKKVEKASKSLPHRRESKRCAESGVVFRPSPFRVHYKHSRNKQFNRTIPVEFFTREHG